MQITLVVVGVHLRPLACRLDLPLLVGRSEHVAITINDPLVSRKHCRIEEREGKPWVRDLESLNGTFVGDQKVSEAELPVDEFLTVGPITFRIASSEAEPAGVEWCEPGEFSRRITKPRASSGASNLSSNLKSRVEPPAMLDVAGAETNEPGLEHDPFPPNHETGPAIEE